MTAPMSLCIRNISYAMCDIQEILRAFEDIATIRAFNFVKTNECVRSRTTKQKVRSAGNIILTIGEWCDTEKAYKYICKVRGCTYVNILCKSGVWTEFDVSSWNPKISATKFFADTKPYKLEDGEIDEVAEKIQAMETACRILKDIQDANKLSQREIEFVDANKLSQREIDDLLRECVSGINHRLYEKPDEVLDELLMV